MCVVAASRRRLRPQLPLASVPFMTTSAPGAPGPSAPAATPAAAAGPGLGLGSAPPPADALAAAGAAPPAAARTSMSRRKLQRLRICAPHVSGSMLALLGHW